MIEVDGNTRGQRVAPVGHWAEPVDLASASTAGQLRGTI